jgi:outer membrane autotransporter protein
MRSPLPRTKILAAAVLCSLFTATPVWAGTLPPQADDTVMTSNTADTPYTSINVSTKTTTHILRSTAIWNKTNEDMTVYMADGGTITANDTRGGANTAAINVGADKTLTVTGALNLTAAATGTKYGAISFGTKNEGILNLGAAGAVNKITVTAAGAPASTGNADAIACGLRQDVVFEAGTTTLATYQTNIKGSTILNVSATGGTTSGTDSDASAGARAAAIGTYTYDPLLSLSLPFSDRGVGAFNLGAVTANVTATGGTSTLESNNSETMALGVNTSYWGKLTADSLNLTVTAQGATAAGETVNLATYAYGLNQDNYPVSRESEGSQTRITDKDATSSITVSGDTILKVTATGSGTVSKGDATAYGINNNSRIYVFPDMAAMQLQAVKGTVTARGGSIQPEGSNSITAYGIYNTGDLSMSSLDMAVRAAGVTINADSGTSLVKAEGLYNLYRSSYKNGSGSLSITGDTKLDVSAAGAGFTGTGRLEDDDVEAWGLEIDSNMPQQSNVTLGNVTANVTANGGSINAPAAGSRVMAYGFDLDGPATLDNLDLTVSATGGTVCGPAAEGEIVVGSFGLTSLEKNGQLLLNGDTTFKVSATAGTTKDGGTIHNNITRAAGIYLKDGEDLVYNLGRVSGTVTASGDSSTEAAGSVTTADGINAQNSKVTTGAVDLDVRATGGTAAATHNVTAAAGLAAEDGGTLQVNGDAKVKAAVTMVQGASGWGYNRAQAVYASGTNSVVNVGTDGKNSLGKLVQLEGDLEARDGGVVNVTLDRDGSYLQGNIQVSYEVDPDNHKKVTPTGTVNLTVADGGTWRPVYDNRNGTRYVETQKIENNVVISDIKESEPPDTTYAANGTGNLTLQDGGIVDLTWDNPTRTDAWRILVVRNLTGDGGVFKINSDLANNKVDSISIGAASSSTQAYIDVAYDPYFTGETLSAGKAVTGKATVVTASSTTMTFTGKQDSYNLYTYTPTLVNNGDGTWDLTALTIDKAKVSGHVKTAAHDRLGLNSLFQFETNSLSRRLGELRDANPTSGIWARYYDGKLEQGDASLKANLFQAGYDKRSDGKTEKTYRGAALSYAKGDGTYALGTGDMKETTFSLYQTGIKNDGRYYDVVLKAGKYMNDYDVTQTANPSSADYSTWAYSLSGEMGKRIDLGKGLYVEPQAEVILGRLNGADYTTSTGMNVSVDTQNKAITRLGLAFGKSYARGSLYGKFSYYHDFGTGVDLNAADGGNSVGYSEDLARNWTELTIGGSAKLGKNANAYAEVSKYMGQLTSNVRYNIGARWSF